jgi:hypothetical protein
MGDLRKPKPVPKPAPPKKPVVRSNATKQLIKELNERSKELFDKDK